MGSIREVRAIGLAAIGVTLLVALPGDVTAGQPQDPAFEEFVYVSSGSLTKATSMVWAPDGRLFVLRQNGEIKTVRNGSVVATFASLSVLNRSGFAGALGICVDQNYSSNKHVYVLATVGTNDSQIVRWTAHGDTGANKTVILGGLPTRAVQHDGGGIEMGPDGKLYFGMGDLGTGLGVDGDTSSLGSKIGRCNADGSAPSDNPYYNAADGITDKDYIWARGVRNAYTLTFRTSNGSLWVNVVGEKYEQVFQVNRNDHCGWNDFEGPNPPAGYLKPKISYTTNGSHNMGGCVGGGSFYDGTSYPAAYRDNFFWGDYNSNKIFRSVVDANNNVLSTETFVTGVTGYVDIDVGPDGALYYIGHQSGGSGNVYRLQVKSAPSQEILVDRTNLSVNEGASGSFGVKLAVPPAGTVTVNVARTSGDAETTVSPGILTFSSANWNAYQTVTVAAGADPDMNDESAVITCSSAGLPSKTVAVAITDTTATSTAPTASITKPQEGDTVSGSSAEFFGAGTDDQGTVQAEFYVDGVLEYTDVNSTGHYHYGGTHNNWDTTVLADGPHTLKMTVTDADGNSGSHQINVTVDNGPPPTGGTGLQAEYFNDPDLATVVLTRVDPTVDFDWGAGSPDPAIDPDTFSARWTGWVESEYGEDYTFYANTNDGVRLWIDGSLQIDDWTDGYYERSTHPIPLAAGQVVEIRMEFYEGGGTAVAQLLWSSPSTPKGVIPVHLLSTSPPSGGGTGGGGAGGGGAPAAGGRGSKGGCGTTGMETVAILGLLSLVRGRKSRRRHGRGA